MGESHFVAHEACPQCGSQDNLARYSDGHAVCFGCDHYEHADSDEERPVSENKKNKEFTPFKGEPEALRSRRISEATCRKFGYLIGEVRGAKAHICNVRNEEGTLVGQKLRFKGKEFSCNGKIGNDLLIGMHLWSGGRKIVITEGEIDMLSYAEVTNCKYPVVSLPNGAQSAKKVITNCSKYLSKFDEVVLLFDSDEVGLKAAKECLPILGAGKIVLAKIPEFKDANEALVAGKTKDIINAIYNAEAYKPSAIVTVKDIYENALKVPEMGLSFPWPTATKVTLGIRRGEIHIVGAAPKIGKTEHQHQLIKHMTEVHNLKVGVMSLEEKPVKTAKKIAGKYMNRQFTKPPEVGGWTEAELKAGLDMINDKIEFYSSEGVRDYEEILATIRYWAAQGIWFFIIDPLTALVAEHDASSANDILNEFMSKAASMAIELDVTMFMYSHLNPPKTGLSHDSGGLPLSSQFTSSRALEKWSHYGWGIQRDRTEECPIKRNTGNHILLYDREFGEYAKYPCFYDSERNDYREIDPESDPEQFSEDEVF